MSSKKGHGKTSVAGTTDSPSKGKGTSEDLSHGVADISLDSAQDGDWQVFSRKPKNKAGNSATKSSAPNPKAWGQPDVVQKLGLANNSGSVRDSGNSWPSVNTDARRPAGRGNLRPQSSDRAFGSNYSTSQTVNPPRWDHGQTWSAKVAATQYSEDGTGRNSIHLGHNPVDDDIDNDKVDSDNDSDAADTDDELLSDEFDSDASVKSHDSRKKSNWFKAFFEILDKLTVEEMNEPARQWHCPACQNGPGSIDWFRGLHPLMTHAKTKGSKRVRLHREFAELLDEELRRRGTSVLPAGEAFGKWKGVNESLNDREIVWPPMVIIMNTRLEQGEDDKWKGMGNEELVDYFSSYDPKKARHSYGPQGHRGMSVLIFESSAIGFLDAERLHKHFVEQGTDREVWDRRPVLFYPGGHRQLYGYMAEKEDLDIFNRHCQGKSRLKFEMRSYEMVMNQMKQMSEDNQQLTWFKSKMAKEQRHSRAVEESLGLLSEKLRKREVENRIVMQRSKMHHEQNKEEMDSQEQFFNDTLKNMHEARDAKEESFEKMKQDELQMVKQSSANLSTTEDPRRRVEEIAKFINVQNKDMEAFAEEREELIKTHEDVINVIKRRLWEEVVEAEKNFDARLNRLMEKYSQHQPGKATNGQ